MVNTNIGFNICPLATPENIYGRTEVSVHCFYCFLYSDPY